MAHPQSALELTTEVIVGVDCKPELKDVPATFSDSEDVSNGRITALPSFVLRAAVQVFVEAGFDSDCALIWATELSIELQYRLGQLRTVQSDALLSADMRLTLEHQLLDRIGKLQTLFGAIFV